jgi:opacity protein-like surface antigen
MMNKTFLIILVFCIFGGSAAVAQPVMAGVKIGAPLTDAFDVSKSPTFAAFTADANSYVWGFFVEVKLPLKFSVEADALYRGYNFGVAGSSQGAHSWEFPILAKYHFLKGPIKPFVDGGLSFSHLSDVAQLASPNHTTNFGIVLGAGVQINALVLKISPEIRYAGYTMKNFDGLINSNRNQLAFLVGIGF